MSLTTTILVLALGIAVAYYMTRTEDTVDVKSLNDSYDYIIVGSGSSGSVLASRLSEDPESSVVLLEAGGVETNNQFINIPAAAMKVQRSEEDWAFYTQPQKFSSFALKDKKSFWPRGKVLGGTSNLNLMVYIRGSRHDYDEWASEGCTGWSYKDVLPYFLKSENIEIDEFKDSVFHSKGGPLSVSNSAKLPLAEMFIKAGQELGYKVVDCNGKDQLGFCRSQSTIKKGQRHSTVKAFLRPVLERNNLHVSTHTLVTKVIIEDKKAVGVEIIKNGRKKTLRANKEVVLSAGAVSSPHILMLSGIGPKEHLEELGIPVIADLPVGENLQDHMFINVGHYINTTDSLTAEKAESLWSIAKYILFGSGLLTTSTIESTAFFDTNPKTKYADIQFHFLSSIGGGQKPADLRQLMETINLKKDIQDKVLKIAQSYTLEGFAILPTLLHPKSRGTIRLQSKDPFDPPLIDPHYLEHPDDVHIFIKGIRIYEKLVETSVFKKIGASKDSITLNLFCTEHEFGSDSFWECMVRQFAVTVYHPTTTCRMGGKGDPTAVVDTHLRVKGISGLRVADASIMRNIPSGNTNAPCIMIGEKAADLIRGIDTVRDFREKIRNYVK